MKREEEENRGKGRRIVIERSRAVICVVSCSANFNQVAICLIDSHPLFRSSFSPCSFFSFFLFFLFFSSPSFSFSAQLDASLPRKRTSRDTQSLKSYVTRMLPLRFHVEKKKEKRGKKK